MESNEEKELFRVGYVAYYEDGSESDSPEWLTVASMAEALKLAWTDRVIYRDAIADKPVGVSVYDEDFRILASEGIVPSN